MMATSSRHSRADASPPAPEGPRRRASRPRRRPPRPSRRRRSSRSRRSPSASSSCRSARASSPATTSSRASRGIATKYRTRTALERELKRYERRGATARNRFERQVRKTRTKFERELRQRRSRVERTVKQNRRRFEREVRAVRKDLERQSGVVTSRVEKLVSEAQAPGLVVTTTSPAPAPRRAPSSGKGSPASYPRRRMQHPLLPQPPGRHESGAPSVLKARGSAGCQAVEIAGGADWSPGNQKRRDAGPELDAATSATETAGARNPSARMDGCPPETKYSTPSAP